MKKALMTSAEKLGYGDRYARDIVQVIVNFIAADRIMVLVVRFGNLYGLRKSGWTASLLVLCVSPSVFHPSISCWNRALPCT
jgi:hypothetical protein